MLFFIIVAVVAFVIGFAYEKVEWRGSFGGSLCAGTLCSAATTLIVMVVMLLTTITFYVSDAPTTPAFQERTDLIALKDANMSYIRRGYANDILKYTYIYKEEDKGLATNSIPANYSYINYLDEDEQPYVIKTIYQFKNPIARFFLIDSLLNTEYSVYIPEGSIIVEGEYAIDLE